MTTRIERLLIANRGEIAVRIIRTARRMGIHTVAVYSDADHGSLHTRIADEAWPLGSNELANSYLNIELLIDIAVKAGVQAIHPGYGFLAENPSFVAACEKAELLFIGPSAKAIELMGNKIAARSFVRETGVPMIAGITGSPEELLEKADPKGYPYLIKAAAGGGGKGMRIARDAEELQASLETTSREAKNYFGDGTIYLERYIEDPRHIEIQVLGDQHGHAIHLFERECSVQRRYQKIIEEAPSPTVTPELRNKMGEAAVSIATAIGYASAGTIEFLVDKDLGFYFLEMNTRIQVEHPVTEMITGIDIVEEQIRIAEGCELRYRTEDLNIRGHAIEFRIYAEDVLNDFLPSPGMMHYYREPEGKGIRVDSGIDDPCEIHGFFDPMISKLVIHATDRETALRKGYEALLHYPVQGINTNIPLLMLFTHLDDFRENRISTRYCDLNYDSLRDRMIATRDEPVGTAVIASFIAHQMQTACKPRNVWERIGYWRQQMELRLHVNGEEHSIRIHSLDGKNLSISENGTLLEVTLVNAAEDEIQVILGEQNYRTYLSRGPDGTWYLTLNGYTYHIRRLDELVETDFYIPPDDLHGDGRGIVSPMPGKVLKLNVSRDQTVSKGDILLVVEAMKMENNILAPRDGAIENVLVAEGDNIDTNKILVTLKDAASND